MPETEKTAPTTDATTDATDTAARAASAAPVPAAKGVMDEEKTFPVGLVVRLFAYLVAGHILAFFLYLLFTVGAKG
ncbi:hypothetical protein DVH02_29425 [Streptomyces corynorhini]|uniref:Small hydrophobic protein n=1 Tax=Streptomyces corynorhini TaxID=2282652 RepID=A0A370AZ93_9ACTN|nr:DUF6126 family protein [Streptomyces corynorhini]RDG34641.1 hypothetical protein DVH02_29425 [Streptomyces corynorhini]